MQDDSALREQLLEAQMRLELGEITDDEFAEIERDVLAAHPRDQGPAAGPDLDVAPGQDHRRRHRELRVTDQATLDFACSASRSLLRRQGRRRQDDVRGGAGGRRSRGRAPRAAWCPPIPRTRSATRSASALSSRADGGSAPDGARTPSSSTRRARSRAGCSEHRRAARRHPRARHLARSRGRRRAARSVDSRASTSSSGCSRSSLALAQRPRRSHRLDVIVVDTAPTGHTLRLLAAPETVAAVADVLDAAAARSIG